MNRPHDGQPERNDRKRKVWGRSKKDLQTVKIMIVESNKATNVTLENFEEVSYTQLTLDGVVKVASVIGHYDECNLDDYIPTAMDVQPLQLLKEELADLTCLVESDEPQIVWDILDTTLPDLVHTALCRTVRDGFLFNMVDTVGKEAMRVLLSDIISKLELDGSLLVKQTGSPSHVTHLSTLVQIDKQINGSSSSGSALTSEQKAEKPKLSTADVIVYSQTDIDKPLETKLVISVKSGNDHTERSLLTQLLSRLPYQSGHIYGLLINASKSQMYSVCKEEGLNKVNIFSYKPRVFRHYGHPFRFDSFFELILDIGKVLKI